MSETERSFGEIHFGAAELGNKARTRRLIMLADSLARHPGGTLPQKIKDPAALQAAYRLMQRPEVTHASVFAAHQAETNRAIEQHPGPLLAISDTTELDYSGLESLEEMGQIGNGGRRGYLCHNVLIIDPKCRQALGLANQILHTRVKNTTGRNPTPKPVSRVARKPSLAQSQRAAGTRSEVDRRSGSRGRHL
jgi:hypothetical protein